MELPLVVLDTETATFDGPPHMLELGAIRVLDGEVTDQFVSLVCPEVPILEEATDFHGISAEDVREAPPVGEVLTRFSEWVGDDWMAAHNAPSDARVLGYEYSRAGIAPPPGPFVDTLCLAKRFLPDSPDHKLGTLSEHLDLDAGVLHRALADAVCAWQVLEACCERMDTAPSLAALLGLSGSHTTVKGASPSSPRLSQRTRSLERACREGASVHLLYGAPPAPPATLEVQPRLLFRSQKKGYLEAECRRTGTLKTYRLDRIQRVSPI